MSRSAAGIRIQALLTVFAANFVRWADEWIAPGSNTPPAALTAS